jgi:hypothetical protein
MTTMTSECGCPEDCEGGPECLDDEGGPLPEPYKFAGVIIIEWLKPRAARPDSVMYAALTVISDAVTGKPITTCTNLTVRADMGGPVTADLTLFADDDGNPIYDGNPHVREGKVITETFSFVVSEMRVRQ